MSKQAVVVIGLQYGDEGKGSITDYLVRKHNAHAVIRFNGGGQARHNVVLPDGRFHGFSQFGAGTFVPDVLTYLSRHFLFDPCALLTEERALQAVGITDAMARLTVHADALVVTPYQMAANKLREGLRGPDCHGSCGMGIGETVADSLSNKHLCITVSDLHYHGRVTLANKLRQIREMKLAQFAHFESSVVPEGLRFPWDLLHQPNSDAEFAELFYDVGHRLNVVGARYPHGLMNHDGTVIFEGAQGVLLDQDYGFHPHTTWSRTTQANALELLSEHGLSGYDGEVSVMGVLRAYCTRHGAGPMVSEDEELSERMKDRFNGNHPWQGKFRVGHLDMVALRYALGVCKQYDRSVDQLAITCLDQLPASNLICTGYKPHNRLHKESVKQLPVWPVTHLPGTAYREMLTDMLWNTSPSLSHIAREGLWAHIQHELDVPVKILSYGPTWKDKKEL